MCQKQKACKSDILNSQPFEEELEFIFYENSTYYQVLSVQRYRTVCIYTIISMRYINKQINTLVIGSGIRDR